MTDDEQATHATISVTINGQERIVPTGSTVGDFLTARGYRVTMVIVELNGEIVPRDRSDRTVLSAGDQVELVHAVGGG